MPLSSWIGPGWWLPAKITFTHFRAPCKIRECHWSPSWERRSKRQFWKIQFIYYCFFFCWFTVALVSTLRGGCLQKARASTPGMFSSLLGCRSQGFQSKEAAIYWLVHWLCFRTAHVKHRSKMALRIVGAIISLLCLHSSLAFPDGGPIDACVKQKANQPNHDNLPPQPIDSLPYIVEASANYYRPGDVITGELFRPSPSSSLSLSL